MPPLPVVPNVLRVDLEYSVGEDTAIITRLHWSYTGGPPSVVDAETLAGDIISAHNTDLKSLLFTGNELIGVRVTDLSSSSGADATIPATQAGSRTGSFLPAGACTLANYHISRRYRGGKPRSYFPFGVQGDMQDGQRWTSGYQTSATSGVVAFFAAVSLLTSGSTTLSEPVNVSYYSGFTVVTSPTTGRARNVAKLRTTPVVDVINTETVAPKIAYQRRRSVR